MKKDVGFLHCSLIRRTCKRTVITHDSLSRLACDDQADLLSWPLTGSAMHRPMVETLRRLSAAVDEFTHMGTK